MRNLWIFSLCAVLLAAPAIVRSQSGGAAQNTSTAANDDGWHFGVAPYAWLAGLRGELSTIAGLPPVTVKRSASQVAEDLDSTFMFIGQARKGRYGGLLGFIYSSTATSGAWPTPEYSTLKTDTQNSTFDVSGFYRAWMWNDAFVDAVLGARIWTAKLQTDLGAGTEAARSASEDRTWVDPMVGAKARRTFGDTGWYVNGFVFVGGFGAGSDYMWDIDGNVGFQWVPSFATVIGWRYLDVKYKKDTFVYDVVQDGLVLAVSFSF